MTTDMNHARSIDRRLRQQRSEVDSTGGRRTIAPENTSFDAPPVIFCVKLCQHFQRFDERFSTESCTVSGASGGVP
jgi:hypothetical protein